MGYWHILAVSLGLIAVGCERSATAIPGSGEELSVAPSSSSLCVAGTAELKSRWSELGESIVLDGDTLDPLDAQTVAVSGDREKLATLLARYEPDSPEVAMIASTIAAADDVESLTFLSGQGFSLSGHPMGSVPLVAASDCGSVEAMSYLLSRHDVSIYTQSWGGMDPMQSAVIQKNPIAAEMLLSHGYSPCNREISTPRGQDLHQLALQMKLDTSQAPWSFLVCQ